MLPGHTMTFEWSLPKPLMKNKSSFQKKKKQTFSVADPPHFDVGNKLMPDRRLNKSPRLPLFKRT